jgi:RNA polymerase sigma factor for flagellar operon FliA
MLAANIYAKRFVNDVEFDDYLQFGMVGLLEAIDRFDIDRGINFKTYSGYRIKGAIYSGLVKYSEKRAQSDYWPELWKDRTDSLVEDSGTTLLFDELVEITVSLALGYILDSNGTRQAQNRVEHPYDNKQLEELGDQISSLISQLPEKEQLIIRYHYYHQVEFNAISDILQIGLSRVSQLHKRALIRLRDLLKPEQGLNAFY